MGTWLDVGTPASSTDYVMVLTGDHNNRPFVGAELMNNGFAAGVLVPHLRLRTEESPWPQEHEVITRVLEIEGVSPENVTLLEPAVRNTQDEARALAAFLKDKPGTTVAVVTSHFHTRRARLAFRQALGDDAERIQFSSAPTDGFALTNWWQSEIGFATVLMEYMKLAAYLARDPASIRIVVFTLMVIIGLSGGLMMRRRINTQDALTNAPQGKPYPA